MKLNLALTALAALLIGSTSFADDRIPLVEGETETFGMVDLTQGQCSMSVVDTETGAQPEVALSPVTVRTGRNFLGGKYLSSWSHDIPGAFASVQIFKGDAGRYLITAGLELIYRGLPDGTYAVKNNQFVALLDSSRNLVDFKERLSYEVRNEKTYAWVNVAGKSRYDSALRSVSQSVGSNGNQVSFTRTTEAGITVNLTCNL